MFEDLKKSCIRYAQQKDVNFTYKGKKLSHEEVFADFGVLPGIMKRASKFSTVCLGQAFQASYPEEKRSYLGYKVELKDSKIPLSLMMLFIVDILETVIGSRGGGAIVPLDEFGYE